ncbi:MAG: rod shape-determining protein MreD [Synechococcales cyanobacterium RM1_1_8]|nr:rod shape-determining protein MreD [Synechococcales cyanobacterium RM1_1_8]
MLNWLIVVLSVLACVLLSLSRLPGTQLADVSVNWLMVWVVSWSVRRSLLQGAIAGLILGLIQDSLTATQPSHVLGLVAVGVLTALLQKQRYIQEDFVSVALIVFAMAILSETIFALQLTFLVQDYSLPIVTGAGEFSLGDSLLDADLSQGSDLGWVELRGYQPAEIWPRHQRVALSSAIVSSLWAPLIAYPLNRWWEWLERSQELPR